MLRINNPTMLTNFLLELYESGIIPELLTTWNVERSYLQIAGYVEGLKQEYPEANVSQFVIYCFGNMGFKVFEIK